MTNTYEILDGATAINTILADTTNAEADFQWVTGRTNAQALTFTFTYIII